MHALYRANITFMIQHNFMLESIKETKIETRNDDSSGAQ